jgi:flagellar biosynthetic protein FliP
MSVSSSPDRSSPLTDTNISRQKEVFLSNTRNIICGTFSNKTLFWMLTILLMALAASTVMAQNATNPNIAIPRISIGVGGSNNPKDVAVTLQILFLLTILTLAPSILIMTTSFTRIIIVLSIMRSALGVPTIPPNQVLISLALFMTFFIMRPTFTQINDNALQPYFNKRITFQTALNRAQLPMRSFMIRQTYTKDLQLFVNLARLPKPPQTLNDIPTTVIIPAFITSELKTAFIIGFYIYLPFLIIDMVVASTLMSMGMMMLPPTVISLPAKLLLFVLANGWNLLLGSLAKGFR